MERIGSIRGKLTSKTNHNPKLTRLRQPLQQAIRHKPHIKQTNLTPRKPQHTKEPRIRPQRFGIIDFVQTRKRRQVRDEEEIVEEFDRGGFLVASELGTGRVDISYV